MAKEYDGEPRWDGIDPAVRAECERRWAEMEARAADPEVQAATEEAVAVARAADPPWEQPGWVPPAPTREYPEGELLARARKRLELTRGPPGCLHLRAIHYKDLLGKRTKTQEQKDMAKLRDARNKLRKLGDVVRTNMFNDWLDRCVVKVEQPTDWTRASDLYDSYVRHARKYGPSLQDGEKATKTDQKVAREEMATETAWGKMMGSLFIKKRRRAGQYYPLRLKQGA